MPTTTKSRMARRAQAPRVTAGQSVQRSRPTRQGGSRGGGRGPPPARLQRNEIIERGIPGFRALSYRTKLTYYDVATISTGAGSAGTRVYSTNGLYDPDITGAGHQPMPFDQLMLSFEHYVTTSAKIEVTFKNTSTTNTMSCALSINASATPVTAYGQLAENGILVRDRLGMYPYADAVKTLSMPCDVGKFGDVRNLLDNPNYEGSVAANPVEQSYFHISCWNPDTVSSTDCICEIYITYQAVFREPRRNSPSLELALKNLILAELPPKQDTAEAVPETKLSPPPVQEMPLPGMPVATIEDGYEVVDCYGSKGDWMGCQMRLQGAPPSFGGYHHEVVRPPAFKLRTGPGFHVLGAGGGD